MPRNSSSSQIAGVSEAIEIHQRFDLSAVDDMLDPIRADESAAASDEKVHFGNSAMTSFAPFGTGTSTLLPPGQRTIT